jgi:ADP-ribose pyrophosphatase YjhB (NUDIX family)
MANEYPNLVITFLIEYKGSFLLVKRSQDEANFPGLWAFPGGKVEIGETVVDTIKREIKEETNLDTTGELILLDAYCFGRSTGVAFLVRVDGDQVVPDDYEEYKWIKTKDELESLPRIPGIDNHLVAALRELRRGHWQTLDEIQLSEDRYLNR